MRRALCALSLASCLLGTGDDLRKARAVGGGLEGGVWGVAFDGGTLVVSTTKAVYRLSGGSFTALTTAGLEYPNYLSVDSKGTIYVRTKGPGLARLVRGAAAWEPFDDGLGCAWPPVEASDGILYFTAKTGELYYRAPGDATWTSTGRFGTYAIADGAANVWVRTGETFWRVRKNDALPFDNPFQPLTHNLPYSALGFRDGKLWATSTNYVEKSGYAYAWDPAMKTGVQVNDGACDGDIALVCDDLTPPGAGFVSQAALSPSGDIYTIWAGQNGSYPYLLRLAHGAKRWSVVADLGDVWLGTSSMALAVSPASGAIYVTGTDYNGLYNPSDGTYSEGTFSGAVYEVR